MVISATPHETRVAILEDDLVTEIFIEREHSRGVVGNIYKGRVSKVLPGMQSAFVNLGLERDAFLYVTDVISPSEAELEDEDEEPAIPPTPIIEADDPNAPASVAGDTEGKPIQNQAMVNASGQSRRSDRRREQAAPTSKIEDLLKEGQEVVVQVVKEPLGTKGARITSHISLPGRFLVYMPTVEHIGVSRKIDSRDERKRLRGIVQKFKEEHGLVGGVIIRTAASHRSDEDVNADLSYFHQIWTDIQKKRESGRPPAALFREDSLVSKLLRDLLTEQFTAIRIDDEVEFRRV